MSETLRRILSAAVLLPILVFCITYTGLYYIPMFLFGGLAVYLGLNEYYSFADRGPDGRPFRGLGFFFAYLIYTIFYFKLLNQQKVFPLPDTFVSMSKVLYPPFDLVVPSLTLLFMLSYGLQIVKRPLDGAIFSVSATVTGVMYISLAIGAFLLLLAYKNGVYYIWLAAGITMTMDTGAYFGGRWFGKHPAGLQVSPKKTVEGYVMGVIWAIAYVYGLNFVWLQITSQVAPTGMVESFFFALLFSFITVLGDLAESSMKRDAKIKDSSSVVPGHGGTLDVIDAMLFTIPSMYFYIQVKQYMGIEI